MSAPTINGAGLTLGAFTFKRATATLTNAQIKALPSTPITLAAAPGASTMLVPVMASVRCLSTSGGYTNINLTYSALSISYLDNTGPWAALLAVNSTTSTPDVTTLTDLMGTSDNTVFAGPYASTPGDEGYVLSAVVGSSFLLNQPLVVCIDNNGSGALTGGNAANSMVVSVVYVEIG